MPIQKITKTGRALQKEIQEKAVSYILAAFGLIAGLAWNDAIKAFIESVFPSSDDTIVAKFIYALVLTAAIVVISTWLVRLSKKVTK